MRLNHLLRRPDRAFAAVAVTAMVVTGVAFSAPATASVAPASADQTAAWAPCTYAPNLECATITVPRDWAHPDAGPTLQIAISRAVATDPAHRKGILFTNPGGPSGSGLYLPDGLAKAQPNLAAAYDIIGMDPRGVGASTQLTCDIDFDAVVEFSNYDLRDMSDAGIASRHNLSKAIADGCANNSLTPYVNTWQTAHDIDLIRALLGEDKLNYVGYSYGTWLGAKYAALFPSHAGKMILDSNTAWMDDLSASWEQMPMAFQRRWAQQFLTYTARSPYFAKYLGTTTAAVNTAYEQSRAAYAQYLLQLGGGAQAGSSLDAILLQGLYNDLGIAQNAANLGLLKVCLVDNTDWSSDAVFACVIQYVTDLSNDLPANTAILQSIKALNGDPAGLIQAPTGSGADPLQAAVQAASHAPAGTETYPLPGVYYAVRCGDGGQWHSPSWWANYQRKITPTYPLAGYQITGMEVCSQWTLPAQKLPNPDSRQVGPIVTVQAEFDAATAYESTNRNLAQYADARLVAVQDGGAHGQYGIRGNSCVDDIVNAWLLSDTAPSARTVCNATPLWFETTVFPQQGPVDDKSRPRSTHATVFSPQLQAQLNDLIDNVG